MAKINRYDGNVVAFGSEAIGTERTVFGDTTQSDSLDQNLNSFYRRGFGIVDVNEAPTKQDFNAVNFTNSQLIAYLHQAGIAEWNTSQEYHTGSLANVNGIVYKSKTDNNVGNDPTTDTTNWTTSEPNQIQLLSTYDNGTRTDAEILTAATSAMSILGKSLIIDQPVDLGGASVDCLGVGLVWLDRSNTITNGTLTNYGITNTPNQFKTIQGLRDSFGLIEDEFVQVSGYYEPADGGGGPMRVWKTGAVGEFVDNGGSIIVPTGGDGSGAWVFTGVKKMNASHFGASPSLANNSDAFQKSIAAAVAEGVRTVTANPGNYVASFTDDVGIDVFDYHGVTLTSATAGEYALTLTQGNSWKQKTINGLNIDGVDRTRSGIKFEGSFTGRYTFNEVSVINCEYGVKKERGNIGNIYNGIQLIRNTYGFYAESYEGGVEPFMHAGADTWNGGYVSSNEKAGILYAELKNGGAVVFNQVVVEKNEGFGVFLYKNTNVPYAGAYILNNCWFEANNTSSPLTPINVPILSGNEYFDINGDFTGEYSAYFIKGSGSEINGFIIEQNSGDFVDRVRLKNLSITDSGNKVFSPFNVVAEGVTINSNLIALSPIISCVDLKSVKLIQSRGGNLFRRPKAKNVTGKYKNTDSDGIWSNPAQLGITPEVVYNAAYPNSGNRVTNLFPSDSYKLIDDTAVLSGGEVLVHGCTIMKNAELDFNLVGYMRVDGVHAFGSMPRFTIPSDALPVGVPVHFIFVTEASAGVNNVYWQANGTGIDITVWDAYQTVMDSEEEFLEFYNNDRWPELPAP